MKIDELKSLLRPMIKELIKEALMEEKGVLAHVIKESMSIVSDKDTRSIPLEENRQVSDQMFRKVDGGENFVRTAPSSLPAQEKKQLTETKKKLMESIGRDAYNGINVFEGTVPLSNAQISDPSPMSVPSPLAHMDPSDEGVPIDKMFKTSDLWGKIAAGKKKK